MEPFKKTWFLNFPQVLVSVLTSYYNHLNLLDVNGEHKEDSYLKTAIQNDSVKKTNH